MLSSKHRYNEVMLIGNLKEEIKNLKNIINDLILTVAMYIDDYPFDEDHKTKQRMLVKYGYFTLNTPINNRAMAKYAGVKYTGNDLVEVILTEEEARHILDVFDFLINCCNYPEEKQSALINISKQINNQIEYEPNKGT